MRAGLALAVKRWEPGPARLGWSIRLTHDNSLPSDNPARARDNDFTFSKVSFFKLLFVNTTTATQTYAKIMSELGGQ